MSWYRVILKNLLTQFESSIYVQNCKNINRGVDLLSDDNLLSVFNYCNHYYGVDHFLITKQQFKISICFKLLLIQMVVIMKNFQPMQPLTDENNDVLTVNFIKYYYLFILKYVYSRM